MIFIRFAPFNKLSYGIIMITIAAMNTTGQYGNVPSHTVIRGFPFSMYAPRGTGEGVKSPIHFHCILHAKRVRGPDSM